MEFIRRRYSINEIEAVLNENIDIETSEGVEYLEIYKDIGLKVDYKYKGYEIEVSPVFNNNGDCIKINIRVGNISRDYEVCHEYRGIKEEEDRIEKIVKDIVRNLYRLKHNIIRAIYWDGNRERVGAFLNELIVDNLEDIEFRFDNDKVFINSNSGMIEVDKGDYIVRISRGIYISLNPNTFHNLFIK